MEMPKSIKLFEQLYLGSLAFGIIQVALYSSEYSNELGLREGAVYWIFGSQVLIFVIIGTLVFLTSRKKSVICKWINTAFFVLGLVTFIPTPIPSLATLIEQGVMVVISAVQVLLQAYAIYLLFNNDSKAWFASKS